MWVLLGLSGAKYYLSCQAYSSQWNKLVSIRAKISWHFYECREMGNTRTLRYTKRLMYFGMSVPPHPTSRYCSNLYFISHPSLSLSHMHTYKICWQRELLLIFFLMYHNEQETYLMKYFQRSIFNYHLQST